MGRRGIAPKPTALRILDGDRESRINRNEPLPGDGPIEPTQELSADAQVAWDRMAPELAAKHVMTFWDAQAFTTYCMTVATYQEAARKLSEEGMVAQGAAGGVIKSPYWQIMRDAIAVMTTIGGRFGLTPSDRAQLTVRKEGSAGGAERLIG